LAFNPETIKYKVEKIQIDVSPSFPPKPPTLKFNLIINNENFYDILMEHIRIRITVTNTDYFFDKRDFLIRANQKLEINVEKVLDLFNFGKSTFSYFVMMEAYKYKIRGFCKVDGDIYKIRGISKDKNDLKKD
jgi:hypothetical protein